MAKNKQSNLIASVKMLNIGFVKKYTVRDKLKNMGGAIQYYLITSSIF